MHRASLTHIVLVLFQYLHENDFAIEWLRMLHNNTWTKGAHQWNEDVEIVDGVTRLGYQSFHSIRNQSLRDSFKVALMADKIPEDCLRWCGHARRYKDEIEVANQLVIQHKLAEP